MSRPERRRSALAGSSPVAPPPAATEAARAPQQDLTGPAPPSSEPARPVSAARVSSPGTPVAKAREPKKVKAGFYASPTDLDRARAAFNNLPAAVRPRSFSDFLVDAMMAAVEEAERRYNDGEPWPPASAGVIRRGRPWP